MQLRMPKEKRFRRAIKLYEVAEVQSMTNLFNRNRCFESGDSPLTLATQQGHEVIVESLLNAGADVNRLDGNGLAAIHVACQLNDLLTLRVRIPCRPFNPIHQLIATEDYSREKPSKDTMHWVQNLPAVYILYIFNAVSQWHICRKCPSNCDHRHHRYRKFLKRPLQKNWALHGKPKIVEWKF